MFSVDIKNEDGFEKVILKDTVSSTTAIVLPACGGMLHEFSFINNGKIINVTENYKSAEDFKNNVEQGGFKGSKLSPFVCRLQKGSYRFGEKKYKVQGHHLDGNAIHGLLYKKSFATNSYAANENYATVNMKYEYRADDAGYPFNYDCIITWQLEKNNFLSVTTECVNKDAGLVPMQDGWHPYFNLGGSVDDLQLEFQSKEMVEFNSNLLPTKNLIAYTEFNSLKKIGNVFFDNCFTLNMNACQPMCVLRNPLKKFEIEIHPDKSYPFLQVYIPPARTSIAIENLSGAPDAFNNNMGVITLELGASAIFKTSYKITTLN